MKCFKIKPTISYGVGCAIVAAHSVEEAINTYCIEEFNEYLYSELDCSCNLIYGLHYDITNPKIVVNEINMP